MRYTFIIALWCGLSVVVFAQKPLQDSSYKARIDGLTAKDSAFGAKAKKIIPKKLYELRFRDIYSSEQQQVKAIEKNPYTEFEGRLIHQVIIKRLNVFGYSVYDTLQKPSNWLDRMANKLHKNTQESIVASNFLFFEMGDKIDPDKMQNNERYLRQQGIFHDARIVVVPYRSYTSIVDVVVIVQDIWSLLPDVSVGSLTNWGIGLEQRNFRGLGHSFKNSVHYNGTDPRQQWEYRNRYFIPSMGRSFVSALGESALERDSKFIDFKVFRPFITPQTKYAGSLEVGYFKERKGEFFTKNTNDTLFYFWTTHRLLDGWLGRSFPVFWGSANFKKDARLVLSARYTNITFTQLYAPLTTNNSNYQNISAFLVGVGLSNRRYVRDLLIFGFGRTEDVPVGQSVVAILGQDRAYNHARPYLGLKASMARYFSKGYFYGLVNVGGFLNNGFEQGVFATETNYISPLLPVKKSNVRILASLKFTTGIKRPADDYFNISGNDGIRGVYSDALRGSQKLVLNLESVWFSNINVLGFRLAPFAFSDVGFVGFGSEKFFNNPYSGHGLGLRVRNENLTFTTFQIRLGYYPNIPNLVNPLRFDASSIASLRFRDFDISAPDILVFR